MPLYMLVDPADDCVVEARFSHKVVSKEKVAKIIFGHKQNGLDTLSLHIEGISEDSMPGIHNAVALMQMAAAPVREDAEIDTMLKGLLITLLNIGRMSKRQLKQ